MHFLYSARRAAGPARARPSAPRPLAPRHHRGHAPVVMAAVHG